MKKTTYVIITALVIILLAGIALSAYCGYTATTWRPMSERVETETVEVFD